MFSFNSYTHQALLVIAVFLVFTTFWQVVVRVYNIPHFVLPAPSDIGKYLITLIGQPALWYDLKVTLQETFLGYFFSILISVIFGVAIFQFNFLEKSLMPYIVAFQTIPSIALAPIYLQWFGYGMVSKVVMATTISCFPILVNVITGLRASSNDEVQMLRAFGASRLQVLLKVRVPNSLPYVFAGLKLGIILSLIGAIVAEFVGAQAGLGNRILQYNEQFNIPGMFSVLIILGLIGISSHTIISHINARVVFWVDSHEDKH
ncbi:ABC transporter permease [Yersinia intermedia]|uniref:ABC transporter permease n=1 Tax=Yersinia intermedia TaxID=631 RepID=UPI0030D5ECFC